MIEIVEKSYKEQQIANRVTQHFNDSIEAKKATQLVMTNNIAAAALMLHKALSNGNKILCCGNGGSAADSQHFVAELINRFEIERAPLAAISLTTDTSVITAIGNDYDYTQIFSKQVSALGQKDDVFVAISTSGNSANIITAIKAAHAKNLKIIVISGKDGGDIQKLIRKDDIELRVPAKNTARIQETHILIIHCLCDAIDWLYSKDSME